MPTVSPIKILQLYKANVPGKPDVVISFDIQRGVWLWNGSQTPITNKTWPYVRLELFANGGNVPTFTVCTLADDSGGYLHFERQLRQIEFKCHMLLLNGEMQPEQNNHTTVGLSMSLRKGAKDGKWVVYVVDGSLGDTDWSEYEGSGPLDNALILSGLGEDWFKENTPQERLVNEGKVPGPLLQNAFLAKHLAIPGTEPVPRFPDGSTLKIELLPANSLLNQTDFPTLGFVFRPGDSGSDEHFIRFQLPVNPQPPSDPHIPLKEGDLVPQRFFLPTPDPAIDPSAIPPPKANPLPSKYRLIQRPSDDWLNGNGYIGDPHEPEWLVSLQSTDLGALWNQSLARYQGALRTVRSVNRLSLLPRITLVSPLKKEDVVDLGDDQDELDFNLSAHFIVRLNPGVSGPSMTLDQLDIDDFSIQPLGSWNVIFEFDVNNPTPTIHPPDPIFYSAVVSPLEENDSISFSLGFQAVLDKQVDRNGNPIQEPTGEKLRIGALDLQFGLALPKSTSDTPYQTFRVVDLSPELSRVPRIVGNMKLPIIGVTPGGQDGLPASEYAPDNYSPSPATAERCMDRRFTGSAPVVIPLEDDDAVKPQYILAVNESNPDIYSQTISLTLSLDSSQSIDTSALPKPRVVVVDADPFLVAEVQYAPLTGGTNSNVVAIWNSGNPDGAAWQLQSDAQPFTLTLPAQGIGEEMPKATELSGKDMDPIVPLDFRFSPAAPQILQPSYTPQNFADAPWNLRRILGFPGQRDAGAGVVQLNFELLYGLSCSVNSPMLRLAEIFSLIGRIAGRIAPPQFNTSNLAANNKKNVLTRYEAKRWNWSLFAELYSKRVALLEPRASGNNYGTMIGSSGASAAPEVFSISNGMSCTFRGPADLFYSVDPIDVASVDNDTFTTSDVIPKHNHSKGLRGGVSWPFESPRLFHATVRNPKSSSAIANGLAFSPIGGTGTIEAGFDQNLSTITSITEIGRTSKVSVARMGRIGVFHNLCRYVIEYERDTSVSAQFQGQQTPFANRPVLRKVREFVEILEPVASLPKSGQAFPGSGCVLSIEFKQCIIPVTSAWSSNVGDSGWKIPLWYEPDSHTPPTSGTYTYDRPDVVFNLAGAAGADVECCIFSVDKLFFYTDTGADVDPDPHSWAVVPGVDFHPVPQPIPNPAFSTGNAHETPAYDSPTPFGLNAFTHRVDKGHGRVNVVNGRGAQAIGANLASVTLQRAPAQLPSDQYPIQATLQSIYSAVRVDLFNYVRGDITKISAAADKICADAQTLAKQISDQTKTLVDGAISKETSYLQNWLTQANTELDTLADELRAHLHDAFLSGSKPIDDAKAAITNAVKLEIAASSRRLGGITTTANALAQFAKRVMDQVDFLSKQLVILQNDLQQKLSTASFAFSQDASQLEAQSDAITKTLIAPISQFNQLITQVRSQVQLRAELWMPCSAYVCNVWENSLLPQIAVVQSILTQCQIVVGYANSGADDQIESAVKAVQTAISDAQTAVGLLIFPNLEDQHVKQFYDQLKQYSKATEAIPDFLENLPTLAAGRVGGWLDTAIPKDWSSVSETQINSIVDSIVTQIKATFFNLQVDPFKQVQADISNNARGIAQWLSDSANDVGTEVCDAVAKLKKAAGNALEAARRYLEDALGRFAESVVQALPPINVKLPSGLTLPVLLNHAFGEVPAIPNLGFSLPNVGYFYAPTLPYVSLTPILTKVKDLLPNLSPLSTLVPSFALAERALPVPNLPSFDLSNVFPDFAGLKLTNLFPSLKMPGGSSDAVKITHGIDNSSRTAWVQADIDLKTDTAVIFSAGPMALQIANPRFTSTVRAQAGLNGQVSKQASGAITGDWQLLIAGSPMISLVSTALTFDNDGKIHVNVSPDRVQLSAALSFIQQIIARYTSPDSGFGIYPSATGIETRLSLPIPNTSLGTTGITNLTFNFLFGLAWGDGFQVYCGFGLASPNAPFNLSVFILGGGGHLVATARYRPGKSLSCQIDMALDASAALAISLGPISGSVHINLGMRFIFNSGQGDLSLGIFLIIGGEVSILSIVSANILLRLDATYSNGAFTCTGLFSISIKICWCFTLSVSEEVSCTLGSGGGMTMLEDSLPMPWSIPTPETIFDGAISSIPSKATLDTYSNLANNYLQLVS